MIVSVEELEDYMSEVTFDDAQRRAAENVLLGLQDEMETYLNRPVEVREIVTSALPDLASGFVRLETPVVSITSVVQGGDALAADYYNLVPGGINVGGSWSLNSVVTYMAGLSADRTDGIRAMILRAAAREMTTHHDDVVSIKALATRGGADSGEPAGDDGKTKTGFTDRELQRFSRLRRPTVVSG